MEIESGTPIEIFVEDDFIILQKYSPNRACLVTGDILPDNIENQGGIILSESELPSYLWTVRAVFLDTRDIIVEATGLANSNRQIIDRRQCWFTIKAAYRVLFFAE